MTISKKMIGIYLFLFYCSYRALISELLFDINPIVIIILFLAGGFNSIIKKGYKSFDSRFLILLIIFWCYVFLNGLFFYNLNTLIKGITQYILFVMPLFLIRLDKKKSIVGLFKYYVFLNIPNAVGSIIEYITGKYLLSTSHIQYVNEGVLRTAAFTGSMIELPLLLGISLIFCLYLYNECDKKKVYLVLGILNCIGMILTQSRGPIVAVLVSILTYYILNGSVKKYDKKIIRRIGIVIILFLIAYIFIFELGVLNDTGLQPFVERAKTVLVWTNNEYDHSNATRMNIWRYWIEQIKFHPVFGIGIGVTGSDRTVTMGVTESAILKRLVELGIVGTVLSFSLYFRFFKLANKKIFSNHFSKKEVLVVYSIFVMLVVEGLVLQIDEYFQATSVFWILAPLVLAPPIGDESYYLSNK